MNHPRTQEDFDRWFRASGGDPWGYAHPQILDRIRLSLGFIRRQLGADFSGRILEFGAFDGSLTEPLAALFPAARILANDISTEAFRQLTARTAGLSNVSSWCGDMLSFTASVPESRPGEPTAVLLLECLYYLPAAEQRLLLQRLHDAFPEASLFLSAPITGGKYYTESQLATLLRESGYTITGREVLNFAKMPPVPRLSRKLMRFSSYFRTRYAGQVIYQARPQASR
jgi:2-polyprenyl-3-methyl-5-hydroxy-6-metoxy-1,4-benzoquinol methylase